MVKIKSFGFRIFGGTFTIHLIPTVITVVMMAACIGLGGWQIQRLHWKEGLIAQIHERMQEDNVDVGLSLIPPEEIPNLDYRPGRATGLLQNDHALYLNATSVGSGEGGYDVLVPLALDDGRFVLVNRGWMPYALKDKPLNGDPERSLYSPAGPVTITGILRLPAAEKPLGRPANDTVKNEWYWVDLAAMAAAAGVKEFAPYYLEADDAPHDGMYPVGGQTRVELPNHHFQYALTWFWLALILPVIYCVSSWKRDAAAKAVEGEKSEEASS
jgi:surfeit locus 1 family protein